MRFASTMVLVDEANGYVIADAVKFELDDTAAGDIVVDSTDNEASKNGTWLDKTWTGGGRRSPVRRARPPQPERPDSAVPAMY